MSDSTFFGELRRMARTSTAVGGIAARMAGARMFGIQTDRAAHAEDLRTILGGLKGPLMKVAQFLSSVPDALLCALFVVAYVRTPGSGEGR